MSKLGDEEWDTEVAKIAMAYPSLHRAIVNAHCGKFAWLNDTTRVRLLTAALVALGHQESHRNMNGRPFVGTGDDRELVEMVRALRAAFYRAFPAALHDRPLTENEIMDMQRIFSAKLPGVDRELVKEVG